MRDLLFVENDRDKENLEEESLTVLCLIKLFLTVTINCN